MPSGTSEVYQGHLLTVIAVLAGALSMSVSKQESPAIADKPARRERLPKLLQFGMLTTLSLTILV